MPHHPPTRDDICASVTATAMPAGDVPAGVALRNRFQAMDNLARVFAIGPASGWCC